MSIAAASPRPLSPRTQELLQRAASSGFRLPAKADGAGLPSLCAPRSPLVASTAASAQEEQLDDICRGVAHAAVVLRELVARTGAMPGEFSSPTPQGSRQDDASLRPGSGAGGSQPSGSVSRPQSQQGQERSRRGDGQVAGEERRPNTGCKSPPGVARPVRNAASERGQR